MSTSPEPRPGRDAGGDPDDRLPATPHEERRPHLLGSSPLPRLVVGVAAAYAVLWLLGQGFLETSYTAEWTSRRIAWFFAPSTLLLTLLARRWFPAAFSILGLVLGVLLGELIGGRVFAAEEARLERELAGGHLQSWEPAHPGWWIASLVFIASTAAGALIAWRTARGGASTRQPPWRQGR